MDFTSDDLGWDVYLAIDFGFDNPIVEGAFTKAEAKKQLDAMHPLGMCLVNS